MRVIELQDDEALVLFEWLSVTLEDTPPFLKPEDEAALLVILGQLQTQLAEPFRSDYGELLEAARRQVRTRYQGED